MPTVTVNMSYQEFARLERTARARRMPKEQVLRESFERLPDSAPPASLFDLVGDLAGAIHEPPGLSANSEYIKGYRKNSRQVVPLILPQ
jgi:hypothetical protein